MYLLPAIILASTSSLVAASQTFDTRTCYYAKSNRLLPNPACRLDDGDGLIAGPEYVDVWRHSTATSEADSQSSTNSGPWTQPPRCVQSSNDSLKLCVFTDTRFAQGRGISIVTDPTTAHELSQLPAFRDPKLFAGVNVLPQSPLYEIRELPGRGMGVIAVRTIERGDRIMAYTATTIFHEDIMVESEYHMLQMAVEQLPKATRVRWLELAAHSEGDFYNERINTNAFSEELDETDHLVVIPEIARLNHDCRPNAVYYFDRKTFTQNVHASRTIYAGEEITITYIDPVQARKKRRAATKATWGFECTCSLCTQSPHLARASDERIKSILTLTGQVENFTSASNATPEMAELLVSMYEQERLFGSIAEAYRLAALAYNAVGNEWMAVKYGMKAVEGGIIDSGPLAADVKDLRKLTKAPREHWSWMIRMRDGLDHLS